MFKNKTKRSILSLVLALVMILGMLPSMAVKATEDESQTDGTVLKDISFRLQGVTLNNEAVELPDDLTITVTYTTGDHAGEVIGTVSKSEADSDGFLTVHNVQISADGTGIRRTVDNYERADYEEAVVDYPRMAFPVFPEDDFSGEGAVVVTIFYSGYKGEEKAEESNLEESKPELKSIDEIAQEVLDDKWGTNEERKTRLTEAGYDYDAVQAKVNELVKAREEAAKPEETESKPEESKHELKSIDEIAQEVLDDKWGTNEERKQRLTEAGYDYDAVQDKVNELVKARDEAAKTDDSKTEESKAEESKPAETKPEESKPADTNPGRETNLSESQPPTGDINVMWFVFAGLALAAAAVFTRRTARK